MGGRVRVRVSAVNKMQRVLVLVSVSVAVVEELSTGRKCRA